MSRGSWSNGRPVPLCLARARAVPPIALFAEHGASYSLQRFRAHAVTSADVNADAKKSQGRHIRLPALDLTRTDLSRGSLRYGRPVPSSPATTDLRLENRRRRRRAWPETNISGGLEGDLTKGGVGPTTSGPFRLLLRSGRLIASEANCPRCNREGEAVTETRQCEALASLRLIPGTHWS